MPLCRLITVIAAIVLTTLATYAAAPDIAEDHFSLGTALLKERKPDEALAHLEKAVAAAPSSSECHRALGDAYGMMALKGSKFAAFGRAKKCKAAYEKAVELDPKNVRARVSLGMYLMQAPGIVGGSKKKAYEQLDEIEKLDPETGWNMRIAAYFADKKYAEIRTLLDTRSTTTPDDYSLLYHYGRLSALTGEDVGAGIIKLQRCLAMEPPSGFPTPAHVQFELAKNYERIGEKQSARAAYEAALSLSPNMRDAKAALGKLK